MFILSLKSIKGKFFLISAAAVAAAIVFFIMSSAAPAAFSVPENETGLDISAAAHDEILKFIEQTGYTVNEEPVSVTQVIIPSEFNEVYTQYNLLQKESGFNLEAYKGCAVKKWTYNVLNYPEYEYSDSIRLNLLVYDGKIIGGDVCCLMLDGFMHGLFQKG